MGILSAGSRTDLQRGGRDQLPLEGLGEGGAGAVVDVARRGPLVRRVLAALLGLAASGLEFGERLVLRNKKIIYYHRMNTT